MILFVCFKCAIGIRTVGESIEIESLLTGTAWHPDKYPCPRHSCDGYAQYTTSIDSNALSRIEIHELTPHEAFIAFNGVGLPSERDCGETAVKALFEKSVVSVGTRQIRNANRTVLDWIEFNDGTRLYLAASPHGSTVYRITNPPSYTKEASCV